MERAVAEGDECADILMLLAAIRGGVNGLMTEILEDHIRFHVLDPEARSNSKRARAAEELIDVVRAYLK